jgi:flavodoxin
MNSNCAILTTKGNTCKTVASIIANKISATILFVEDCPNLESYSFFVFVFSNRGDEELTEVYENFIVNLQTLDKKYFLCELGNYFGFEYDFFGCKKILEFLLKKLGWQEVLSISIDSTPVIDFEKLEGWINEIYKRIDE